MILIVDDDHTNRNTLGMFIRKLHPDVVIVHVDHGAKVWEIINAPGSNFDLMISDVRTSQITGSELVEKVRKKHQNLHIILMSGESEPKGHRAHSFSSKDSLRAHLTDEIKKLMAQRA